MKRVAILIACLLLTSCAAVQPPVPAPREMPSPAPGQNAAVESLISAARHQLEQGLPDAAYATLERALHINGRDPEVWHYMAVVRAEQGQWRQVANLARKSNMLTADQHLRARNDGLIEQADATR